MAQLTPGAKEIIEQEERERAEFIEKQAQGLKKRQETQQRERERRRTTPPSELMREDIAQAEAIERQRLAGKAPVPGQEPPKPVPKPAPKPVTKVTAFPEQKTPPAILPSARVTAPFVHKPPFKPLAPPKPRPGELTPRAKRILITQRLTGPQLTQLLKVSPGFEAIRKTMSTKSLKREAKSFVPGWLTIEEWGQMTPLERGVSVASSTGLAILYVGGGGVGTRFLIKGGPAPKLAGTAPKNIPGLKVISKRQADQITNKIIQGTKNARAAKKALAEVKKTIPIKIPVKQGQVVTVINETAQGAKWLKTTVPYKPKPLRPPGKREPPLKVDPKGGVGKQPKPSTRTMTTDKMLEELGLAPVDARTPMILPLVPPVTVPGVVPVPPPVPVPVPVPGPTPKPVPPPAPKPVPPPVPKPVPPPAPKPVPPPAPKPVPPPVPQPIPPPVPQPIPPPVPQPIPPPVPQPIPPPVPQPIPPPVPQPVPPPVAPSVPPVPPPVVPVLIPPLLLPRGGTDKQRRKRISDSKGALGWRQGELRGKDIWQVIMSPYKSNADHVVVIGRKPPNTTIVKGPGSAKQTIRLLYGKPPSKKVTGDIGVFDFFIDPRGTKRVNIGFKPDPKGLTTGDITIGLSRQTPAITERPPRLTGRGKMRITPRRPRLRR